MDCAIGHFWKGRRPDCRGPFLGKCVAPLLRNVREACAIYSSFLVALAAAQVGEMGCGNVFSRDNGSWRAPRTHGTKPLGLADQLETDALRTGGMVCLWPAGRQIRKEISDFPIEPGSTAAVRIRLVATKQQPGCRPTLKCWSPVASTTLSNKDSRMNPSPGERAKRKRPPWLRSAKFQEISLSAM